MRGVDDIAALLFILDRESTGTPCRDPLINKEDEAREYGHRYYVCGADCLACGAAGYVRVFQGVSFRYYTQKEATKLGLQGWCHNRPDESVEGVAVGVAREVERFKEYLSRGPPSATVKTVEYIDQLTDPDDRTVEKKMRGVEEGYHVRRFGESESIVKKGPKETK